MTTPAPAPIAIPIPIPIPIYAIFEGGGAKGIAHVGAIEAIEDQGLVPIGVAGSSAGAIAAALVAVGLPARSIFDPDKMGADIFTRNGEVPEGLIGLADWRWFHRMRKLVWLYALVAAVALLPLLLALGLFWTFLWLLGRDPPPLRLWMGFGLFDTAGARDFIDKVLRDAVAQRTGQPAPSPLCFGDLLPTEEAALFATLRVIAANIETGEAVVFGPETPDVPVADAVVASFSIPFVFRPARVRGAGRESARYVDGGLLANLPVWVFNDEKLLLERGEPDAPPIPVIAFSLRDKPGPSPLGGLRRFAGAVLRTGIFGSQVQARRQTPGLVNVDVPADIGLLDFDCSFDKACEVYLGGRAAAQEMLHRRLRALPAAFRAALGDVIAAAQARAAVLRPGQYPTGTPLHLRASLVLPFGDNSFRVRIALGMEADADDRLIIDPRAPGAPLAFALKRALHVDLSAVPPDARFMTKYELALVRPTLQSIIAVPVFGNPAAWTRPAGQRPKPSAALCLDSDSGLEFLYADANLMAVLETATKGLAPLVADLNRQDTNS
ncbi:patatin-like phospholipase family protein [Sandarakinorhabdus sp.]|uniref:patatin-like phospholipase family protein n=1 Tax=Sandarakinorhabdus sp. TaxID=1916663 RepID=UPI00286D862E|nr:patatin-like phospholipase family protein [Sandarakinorhabdus sp.]